MKILLFSKDALIWSKAIKTYIMLKNIYIANKCCSIDLSVQLKNPEKLYDGFHKNVCSRPTKKLFHQHIKFFFFFFTFLFCFFSNLFCLVSISSVHSLSQTSLTVFSSPPKLKWYSLYSSSSKQHVFTRACMKAFEEEPGLLYHWRFLTEPNLSVSVQTCSWYI